jgi:GDPmannose 4,6-dehydratase
MRAFITGITGQDGYYLSKHLIDLGYDVFGLVRRHSQTETELGTLTRAPFVKKIKWHYGDVTDYSSLERVFHTVKPHEVYNLAAQSHVRVSFDAPQYTVQSNAIGTLNMLEATRQNAPYARFYQASTSEMFGNQIDPDNYQRETTPMIPVSPYGASKLFGHNMVHQYRNSYGLFAVSGILFNHESPLRGGNFVTQKVVRGAVNIWRGNGGKIQLGNLNASRDWGHAADYTKAMHLMLQNTSPVDYTIATGKTTTIRQMVNFVFKFLNEYLYGDRLHFEKHVEIQDIQKRPEDVNFLRGDPSLAETELNWTREYDFEKLMIDMIETEITSTQ